MYKFSNVSKYVTTFETYMTTVWQLHAQDFGDPATNGVNHKVVKTINPVSQKEVQAVFIPKEKDGYWEGSVSHSAQFADTSIVDDDEAALRKNQLYFACIACV